MLFRSLPSGRARRGHRLQRRAAGGAVRDPRARSLLLNVAKAGAVVLSATWNFIGFGTFALIDRRSIEDTQDAR